MSASRPLRLLIYGSCVSRDALGATPDPRIALTGYYARSGMASAFASAPVANLALDGIDSAFQRRMVAADADKSFAAALAREDFDILLHDPIDERFNLLRLADGTLLTRSPEFTRARDPLQGRATATIVSGSPEYLALWERGWRRFLDLLDARGLRGALRVNVVWWAARTVSGADLGPAFPEARIRDANAFLATLYDRMAADLAPAQFLRFDDALMQAADSHKWGLSPFHYNEDFYRGCVRQLVAGAVSSGGRHRLADRAGGAPHSDLRSVQMSFCKVLFPGNKSREEALAARYLAEGIVEVSQFAPVRIERSLWNSGPLQDRSWQWALHSFLPLDCLISTGRAEAVAALVRDWEANCEHAPGEFPWHDHATALRLDRLSRMALQLEGCKFGDLAARHASRLMREDFYSHHTNHGFAQAMSLVLASIAFSKHPDSTLWRQTGAERLNDEIAFAFTEEGVHVENSPGYHLGMMSLLDRAKALLAAADVPFETTQTSLYEGALAFLAWMARPDHNLVYLGDTVQYRVSASEQLQHLKNYPMLRYAATGGAEGLPPNETSKVFEKSGYAAYRSGWKPWSEHTHIVMKCGNLSRYHRHDDDLNLLVHAYGEDWLIDSGLYNHNQKDPIRIYMRSAQAHNIPWFPERSIRRVPSPNRMAKLKRLAREDFALAVEAETRMYDGLRVKRQLLVSGPDRFQIRDHVHVTDPDAMGTSRYWIFHTPLHKKISVSPSAARIRGRKMALMIRLADGQQLPCSVHRGFGDIFSSLFSAKHGEVMDSQAIVFGPSFEDKMRFVCSFEQI